MNSFRRTTPFAVAGLMALLAAAPPIVAPAQAQQRGGQQGQRPAVSVVVGEAVRKPMPVRLDAIGTVQTIASVTVRSRVDSQIMEVPFEDGAMVEEGQVLFRLDSRQIEQQIKQAEANLSRDNASLNLARADLRRAEELAKRDFGTEQRLETARAQVQTLEASVRAGQAALDNLRVQLTFYTIRAPISGRVGVAGLRPGNIARTTESAPALAVINQIRPIYVMFGMPQRHLPDIRKAVTDATATVVATPQGYTEGATGKVALIDNAIDPTTGSIQVRAVFDNTNDLLWPGALTTVRLTLRVEPNAVAVPREAVQASQTGSYVFVIENDVAKVRKVTVSRTIDTETVIESGLDGGETVVTDGQLLLVEGSRVVTRRAPGAAPAQAPRATGNPPAPTPSRSGSAG